LSFFRIYIEDYKYFELGDALDGVKSAEAFIPLRTRLHQDWIIREIDDRVNAN